jgi:1-acyl-sn-glycerol-3-phosphate acyltransferase
MPHNPKTVRWINALLRRALSLALRLDIADFAKIPARGPLILAFNHVNFLDGPIAFSHLETHPLIALVKTENWRNPLFGLLFDLWGSIPIRRGEADLNAIQKALFALNEGKILAIAPEGTRSGNGKLQPGHDGLTLLAYRSGAPILPLVYYGAEAFWPNLRHLRRTDYHVCVGQPFYISTHGKPMNRTLLQEITTEIMYQMASLLPAEYRGVYADLEKASTEHLRFVVLDEIGSPLPHANG